MLNVDGASPITALKEAVRAACDFNLGVEASPVSDSQASGQIAGTIGAAHGQARIIESVLDKDYNAEFGDAHAVIPWLVSCSPSRINEFTLDADGKTARERCRGR